MIVAIDGPAGSGKSSVSKELANLKNIEYLDTGAMYRIVTFSLLSNKINIECEQQVFDHIKEISIDIIGNVFLLDSRKLSSELRSSEVVKSVSKVAAYECVRNYLLEKQREISNGKDIILDGRDIGTVVFPNADFKFFLTASTENRANRRYLETIGTSNEQSYSKILSEIIDRDKQDYSRKISPLKRADDAIEIQTDNLTKEEVVNKMLKIIGD